ncbi:hypothetical protein SK128_012080 [Halocaridina rubra]|uniref:Uncharacterized protein n=1 Tax=Halocaridina rubra TaxID=373956 RepID=A0AAN8ZWQ7_HALRR
MAQGIITKSPSNLLLLLGMVTLLLSQHVTSSYIRIRPNTFKEFQFIKCHGEYDKEQYSSLTQICDDCHNLYRNPDVLLGCKADCFRNTIFPACVSRLLMHDKEAELSKKVYYVSGKRPSLYPEVNNSGGMSLLKE